MPTVRTPSLIVPGISKKMEMNGVRKRNGEGKEVGEREIEENQSESTAGKGDKVREKKHCSFNKCDDLSAQHSELPSVFIPY